MMKMVYAGIAIVIVVILAFLMFRQKPKESTENLTSATPTAKPTQTDMDNTKSFSKPELTIDATKTYSAVLKTSEGDITIELKAKETPITVNNFVYLSEQHFYDNTIFHRVVEGFMIQGGDPTGTGTGGPGYRFDDEPFTGEYVRGTVAMANAGPDTNGSQFFIMHGDMALPKNYVIFGKVTNGLEVVDKIASSPTTFSMGGEKSKPVSPVTINSVDIVKQ